MYYIYCITYFILQKVHFFTEIHTHPTTYAKDRKINDIEMRTHILHYYIHTCLQ